MTGLTGGDIMDSGADARCMALVRCTSCCDLPISVPKCKSKRTWSWVDVSLASCQVHAFGLTVDPTKVGLPRRGSCILQYVTCMQALFGRRPEVRNHDRKSENKSQEPGRRESGNKGAGVMNHGARESGHKGNKGGEISIQRGSGVMQQRLSHVQPRFSCKPCSKRPSRVLFNSEAGLG